MSVQMTSLPRKEAIPWECQPRVQDWNTETRQITFYLSDKKLLYKVIFLLNLKDVLKLLIFSSPNKTIFRVEHKILNKSLFTTIDNSRVQGERRVSKKKGGIVTPALLKSFGADKHLDSSQTIYLGGREGDVGMGPEVGMRDRHINSKS